MKKAIVTLLAVTMTAAMAGCGGAAATETQTPAATETVAEPSYKEDVAAADLQAAVAEELGENYWPQMDVPAEMLPDMFGLTEDMYEEVIAQTPMISVNVDTLVIVKAKEGQEQAVADALLAWKKRNTEEAIQYPMNMGKVQAAMVETYGRYVVLTQLGADTSALADDTEESTAAIIAHCEEANKAALAVIEAKLTE